MSEERKYPKRPIVGVGAAVLHSGKILLVKRGQEPYKGYWSIPGGAQRTGETLAEAALRELKEEAGVEGRVLGVIWVDELIEKDEKGVKFHYVVIDLLVEPTTVEARPSSDAVEVGWFEIGYALRNLKTTESTKRLLKFLLEHGTTKLLPLSSTVEVKS